MLRGQQLGHGAAGRLGTDRRLDLTGLEGAGAERRADPDQQVLIAVRHVLPGQPGAVMQPEHAGRGDTGRIGPAPPRQHVVEQVLQ
jgi:hypothetical protein